MEDFSYITTNLAKILAERPGNMVTILEYACLFTLLIAMISDMLLRRKRPARQEPPIVDRVPIKSASREIPKPQHKPSRHMLSTDAAESPQFETEVNPDTAPECG